MYDLFKSQVVLELEKDNAFYNAQHFKRKITQKYGLVPTTEMYLKVVNYQIKKYGITLDARSGGKSKFVTLRKRLKRREYAERRNSTKEVLERVEKYEKQNMVHNREAS